MLKLYAQAALYKPSCNKGQSGQSPSALPEGSHNATANTVANTESFGVPVLPDTNLSKRVNINPAHCNKYNKLTQWDSGLAALLHPNYVQTLSMPMQLSMMVTQPFPFKPIGMVHIANAINILQLPEQTSQLVLNTHFGKVYYHRRGWLFEVVTSAQVAGHQSDDSKLAAITATSYYLAKHRHTPEQTEYFKIHGDPAPSWIEGLALSPTVDTDSQTNNSLNAAEPVNLGFSHNIGRQYAKVSGDYNPIHLYPITAKLLGFKKAIAHGMYSKAWAVSEIAKRYKNINHNIMIKNAFVQPIYLPSTTLLHMQGSNVSDIEFSMTSQGSRKQRLHLSGHISKL